MFDVFQAASILGHHAELAKWTTGKLPEFAQIIAEARTEIAHAQALLKKHDTTLAEAEKRIPEFQQFVSEIMPLVQQAQAYTMSMNSSNPGDSNVVS